ncbi:MAG: hypothetical protein M1359_10090 [Betaproteobacteria bacterium]|nr:hypothetical protein [Betaproteobacteria bacterium]
MGTEDTFSPFDAINGGAGTDTLNLVFGGTLAAGTTVQNVEIANLASTAAITAANVTGFTGLETLNVASAAAISGVVAAATTNINVLNGMDGVTPESVTSPTKKWQFPIYNKHLAQICCSPCG